MHRNRGIALFVVGASMQAGGAIALQVSEANDTWFGFGDLAVLLVYGCGAIVTSTSTPTILGAGRQARSLVREGGGVPAKSGLDGVGWFTWDAGFIPPFWWRPPVGWVVRPISFGVGLAQTNRMIRDAEATLARSASAGPRLYVNVVPIWQPQTRRAGLRVDVTF